MKHIILFIVSLISFGSLAQNLPAGDPILLGLSKDGLARVDAFMSKESENQHIPGSIGMIVRHGKATEIIHSCGSGVTACHNLLAMEVAGLKGSRLYAGSWSEWCADPKRPVATD